MTAPMFTPGSGVASLDRPVRLKVNNPNTWIALCITRDVMEQQGASREAWLALADAFVREKSPACAERCRRMAKCTGS